MTEIKVGDRVKVLWNFYCARNPAGVEDLKRGDEVVVLRVEKDYPVNGTIAEVVIYECIGGSCRAGENLNYLPIEDVELVEGLRPECSCSSRDLLARGCTCGHLTKTTWGLR